MLKLWGLPCTAAGWFWVSAPVFCRAEHPAWSWVFRGVQGHTARGDLWVQMKAWSRLTFGKVKAPQPSDGCKGACFGCLTVLAATCDLQGGFSSLGLEVNQFAVAQGLRGGSACGTRAPL